MIQVKKSYVLELTEIQAKELYEFLPGSYGSLMIRVMMIRQIYPNHPMFIEGNPV